MVRKLLRLFALFGGFSLGVIVHGQEAPAVDAALARIVGSEKVTVVHTWAPWCPNCHVEFRERAWADFIESHPEVNFVFVEVWNNGEDNHRSLARYDLGGQENLQFLIDPGARSGEKQTKTLLGQKLTWVPSTWVYQRGRVRYAFLYGEIRFDMLEQAIADTTTKW